MLDGAVKTMQVDDSHIVSQLMVVICSRIGESVKSAHFVTIHRFFL